MRGKNVNEIVDVVVVVVDEYSRWWYKKKVKKLLDISLWLGVLSERWSVVSSDWLHKIIQPSVVRAEMPLLVFKRSVSQD